LKIAWLLLRSSWLFLHQFRRLRPTCICYWYVRYLNVSIILIFIIYLNLLGLALYFRASWDLFVLLIKIIHYHSRFQRLINDVMILLSKSILESIAWLNICILRLLQLSIATLSIHLRQLHLLLLLVSKMLLRVRHIILFFTSESFTTIWWCWPISCLKWRLCSYIYPSSYWWVWSRHTSMHCFVLSCSCCSLYIILIIYTCSMIERATCTHVNWIVIVVYHAFCMGFTWCPKIVLIVSTVTSLQIVTTLSKNRVFKILMICHWFHKIVVLWNKPIIISRYLNLICILEMITIYSTWLSSIIS
jgi:hypothetical protein